MDARLYSYYIDRGYELEYLENLDYKTRIFFISSMITNQEERLADLQYLR